MSEPASEFPLSGESLSVTERLIVAPVWGVFRRVDAAFTSDGDLIYRGDVVGTLESRGASTQIQSPFEGLLVSVVARDGERLRPGQPVAWLRTGTL